MSPFPALHSKQAVMRFSMIVLPPFITGFLWSATSFAPSFGVRPQYWHLNPSLLKTWKRIRRLANGFLSSFLRRPPTFGIGPISANSYARFHEPKRMQYTLSLGNPFNFLISLVVGGCPSNLAASINLEIKYLRLIFLGPRLGITINNPGK